LSSHVPVHVCVFVGDKGCLKHIINHEKMESMVTSTIMISGVITHHKTQYQ
jgi:hypothetical protein